MSLTELPNRSRAILILVMAIGSILVKKGELFNGDVAPQYKLGNAIVDMKLDNKANILTTFIVEDILPSSKTIASWKYQITILDRYPSFAFGIEASYMVSSGNFEKYKAGLTLKTPNVCLCYYMNRGATVGEITRKFPTNENTLTVGCSYEFDPHTMVKAKLNNHGHLAALVRHELIPNSTVTISGSFDTLAMEKAPRFVLALSLKP